MKKSIKKFSVMIFTAGMILSSTFTSLASWEQSEQGWKYSKNSVYLSDGWYWLDGNNDNVAECYYFDENGIMSANTIIYDGRQVNSDGQLIIDNVVQTWNVPSSINNNSDNIDKSKAHINLDEWDQGGGVNLDQDLLDRMEEGLNKIR